ncbi:MAG: hypothetical protein AAGI11_15195 [Pseudomonadota bacterium]
MKRRPGKLPKYREPRRRRSTNRSELEHELARQMASTAIPAPIPQYKFCAQHVGAGPGVVSRLRQAGLKNWVFDFAWPQFKFAVEVDGGGWVGGGHNTGQGSARDKQKGHDATRLGWTVYRCDADLIHSGRSLLLIESRLMDYQARAGNLAELVESWDERIQGVKQRRAVAKRAGDMELDGLLGYGQLILENCRRDLARLID